MSVERNGNQGPRSAPAITTFAFNLVLALVWVAMTGHFDVANLVLGFTFGYVVLLLLQRVLGPSRYFSKSIVLVRFSLFYVLEVIRSNLRVAIDVITPASRAHPGIIAVPLEARTDTEIAVLANLVTMTPGSLAVDVADDRSVIFVHSMFAEDPDALVTFVKDDLERRVLELLR